MYTKIKLICLSTIICLFFSCASKEDILYFQDVKDFETIVKENDFSPTFKVDDLISIHISTLNPVASAPFNLVVGQAGDIGGSNNIGGGNNANATQISYLVDEEGNIDFPVLGKLGVEGLTPEQLRVKLRTLLSDYLKDPIINIRLLNFTITVLGEVNRPGTYPVVGEQITILEAIGLAGDLNIRGVRKNILVIRDFNGTKVYRRIDLTSKDAIKSSVYYLTQNDVVYVEPNKAAVDSSASTSGLTVTLSIIGALFAAATLVVTATR